ncbi:Clathrin adaptor complexes medium subunit family protein isoform 1 [Hibiscus syriacus]|uniref:AT-hook motif nuclear-localized protein n=1 Tax=Hibiscus syriacus TaxID=106335 RepID=A0A6A2X9V0_HIBSY|nr:Clathrin adaptor complexes medium subunit family protein isoform 1 [Hibiscus syriacus]
MESREVQGQAAAGRQQEWDFSPSSTIHGYGTNIYILPFKLHLHHLQPDGQYPPSSAHRFAFNHLASPPSHNQHHLQQFHHQNQQQLKPFDSLNSLGGDSFALGSVGAAVEPPPKRNRGRPPGSGKRQIDALGGVSGVGFTPHVITVNAGEDIASKITSFSQQGPRNVCVSLQMVLFVMLHFSSLVVNVSLAGSDGRVVGGGVPGTLQAATPVQVIVGSFIAIRKNRT